ncbi:hypothetical protein K438DRAFT_1728890 [Mycena galopus ATCC 62051]|nr:hypothetical protein K438DRAFT_1728890 [Mycena galopus ATCC 62051]
MIENGLQGFEDFPEASEADEDVDDIDAYGIDWEELHDADIMVHHTEHNADQELDLEAIQNPFSNDAPHRLSHVEVAEPLCLFMLQEVAQVDAHLSLIPHSHSRNMNSHRVVWIEALAFCRQLYE